jgi:predicted XRE-type DNA-binding protein
MKKQKFPSEADLRTARDALAEGPAARPLPKDSNAVDRLKHSICAEFVKFKNKNHLSQKEFASQLGIDEALMSKIINYAHDEFTVDRLMKFLSVLYPNVDVKLLVA